MKEPQQAGFSPRKQKSPVFRQPAILITGAGAGIGLALTEELLRRGHRVYAGVRKPKRAARDMAAFLHEPGLRILELDVNKPAQIQRAVRRIEKESGPLGVLVNNAGYGLYGAFEELPEKEFRAQLETNFFGAMRMVRAVLPGMRSAGRGRILNISSILGRLALPTGSAYTSSKWALEAFSESLRYELLPLGIYTSLIEPGLIRTNFKANMQIAKPAHAKRRSPYGFLTEKIQRDYDGFTTSAAAAARRIASIVERPRPAVRYRVGLDSHAYNFLRRALPERVFDWLLRLVVHTAYRRSNK